MILYANRIYLATFTCRPRAAPWSHARLSDHGVHTLFRSATTYDQSLSARNASIRSCAITAALNLKFT